MLFAPSRRRVPSRASRSWRHSSWTVREFDRQVSGRAAAARVRAPASCFLLQTRCVAQQRPQMLASLPETPCHAAICAAPCAAPRCAPAVRAPARCYAAACPRSPAACDAAPQLSRRMVLAATVATAPLSALSAAPPRAVAEELAWSVPVTLTLSPGAGSAEALLEAFPAAALYVTLRPPGRSPPLAARRVPLASLLPGAPLFPLHLALGPADSLPDAPERELWAAAPQLVVSARLDTDGTAATRGPEDLVGRGAAPRDDASSGGWSEARVELVGRGIAGRLATQRTPK